MEPTGISDGRQGSLPAPDKDWALFLDVDGTISEIADHPEKAVVKQQVLVSLEAIRDALGGALALVSGRTIANLDRMVHPLHLAAAGQHGAEWRLPDGRMKRADGLDPGDLIAARDAFRVLADARPGIVVEEKGLSLSVHFRNAPEAEAEIRALARELVGMLPGHHVSSGKSVVELRPNGVDKGRCITTFMEVPPFAGRRPVFAGDDVTDEDGFAMVNSAGGISIRIGRKGERPTAATWHCKDVATFSDWLSRFAGRGALDD